MTMESLVTALQAKRAGSSWIARCPAHDDRNPSLSRRADNSRILVHCHAGCDQSAVIRALRERGLWPESERSEYPPDWGELVWSYDYCDEHGALLYQVCRFVPKSFRPRHVLPDGSWRWGYGEARRVLYRLPEVLRAPIVFVVEGERDVESLRDHGFIATTVAGGCNAHWLESYTESLRGREVIVIPDMDEPGLARASHIVLTLLGAASDITLFGSDDLHGAKDITEWFESGHSECELIAILERTHGA